MDRPKPPPPPYVSMRKAAERLREDAQTRSWEWADNRWTQLMDEDAARDLAVVLEHLADKAEQVANAGGFIDHEPYLSASSLARRVLEAE